MIKNVLLTSSYIFLFLIFFISPVSAATYTVSVFTDSVDSNPGDSLCANSSGNCSLRAAIMEANSSSVGTDIINLPAGTYSITLSTTGEDAAASGDLDILEDVNIIGLGDDPRDVVIDFNDADQGFHILGNLGNIVDVEIENLRVTDTTGGLTEYGGAFALEYANLTANLIVIDNNTKTGTGSPSFGGSQSQIYITNSVIHTQTGGDGLIASITNGAFRAENSSFFNLTTTQPGGSLILMNDCVTRVSDTIISCEVNILRSTITQTTSPTYFDNIDNMNFLGCGNIIHDNDVSGSAVCLLNDSGATVGYNLLTNQTPDNICTEVTLDDDTSSTINLTTSLQTTLFDYSKNISGQQYLRISSSSSAIDFVPIGSCGCTSGDAVDGDENGTDACDAGAYEYMPTAEVGDYVWIDTDEDGEQNEDENAGLNNVNIKLYADLDGDGDTEPDDDDGSEIDSMDTDDNDDDEPGYYLFENLDPGDYFIVVEEVDGYSFTDKEEGSDSDEDSDVSSRGESDIFTLDVDDSNLSIDIGLVVDSDDSSSNDSSATTTTSSGEEEGETVVTTQDESSSGSGSEIESTSGNAAGDGVSNLSQTGLDSSFFYIIGVMTCIVGGIFSVIGRRYIV
jgi:hypothetical protein